MDLAGLDAAVDRINQQTLPQVRDMLRELLAGIAQEREAILKSVAMERAALMAEVINLRLELEDFKKKLNGASVQFAWGDSA